MRCRKLTAKLAACAGAAAVLALFGPPGTAQIARAAGSAGCGGPGGGQAATDLSIVAAGATRTYRLQVPASYTGLEPVPLVLSFHGFTGTALQQEQLTGLPNLAERHGFILAHPQGLGDPPSWHAGGFFNFLAPPRDDVRFVSTLIDSLQTRYCIDPGRVLVAGISNGGAFVDRLGCELAGRVSAVAAVASAFVRRPAPCMSGARVAVIAVHGDADEITPYEGGPPAFFRPVANVLGGWAQRSRCARKPSSKRIGAKLVKITYRRCRRHAGVRIYKVLGGGHAWPSDASTWIWRFFSTQSARARHDSRPTRNLLTRTSLQRLG